MRINAYLAKSGLSSRRKSEEYVKSGRVLINGKKAVLSDRVENGDIVAVDGKEVTLAQKLYYLLYKPVGYTSTVDDKFARLKVIDLIDQKGLFPVGRLDKESEGLMILTNDGDFAQKLIHPSHSHEREYIVEVKLPFKDRTIKLENAIKFFKCGIKLDNVKTNPSQIKLIKQEGSVAVFNVILTQGIKRQIRRTFEKAGLSVKKLKRIRIASFELGDLEPGESKKFII